MTIDIFYKNEIVMDAKEKVEGYLAVILTIPHKISA